MNRSDCTRRGNLYKQTLAQRYRPDVCRRLRIQGDRTVNANTRYISIGKLPLPASQTGTDPKTRNDEDEEAWHTGGNGSNCWREYAHSTRRCLRHGIYRVEFWIPTGGKSQHQATDLVSLSCTLLNQFTTYAMYCLHILLINRLNRYKTHVRTTYRFTNRLCIIHIVLITFYIRLYILGGISFTW